VKQSVIESDAIKIAAAIEADIQSLPVRNTQTMRAVRRKYSQALRDAPANFVFQLAMNLRKVDGTRWIAYELIQGHREAFERLGAAELEELGEGTHSWWTVDAFSRTLSGPAWLRR
jgi:hypothetical protein